MMIKRTIRNVLTLAALSLTLPACTSTDLLYDAEGNPPSDEIVLSISMPEDALLTRAGEIPHQGHTLRYTAKLFNSSNGKLIATQQALATDNPEEVLQIKFEAIEGESYKVFVFADYITAQEIGNKNESTGIYPDRYFNTTNNDETIDMIAFTKDGGKTSCGYNPINNDNYDCFYFIKTGIDKTSKKIEIDAPMKRAISKVRFVNSFATDKKVTSIKFNKFAYLGTYSMFGQTASNHKNQNLALNSVVLDALSDAANNEFFYFYTFAGKDADDSNNLKDIEFTVTFNDNTTQTTTTVDKTRINVRRNYVTTVKGAFTPLPGPTNDDYIYLNITTNTNQNWGSPDQTTDYTK